jgi:micrococcal nuclease
MARLRVGLVALAAGIGVLGAAGTGWWAAGAPAVHPATVVTVVDGDTIEVALVDGRHTTVRILGVDTPETKHPEIGVECFGPEAAAHTAARLAGRRIELELDRETVDPYGRLLAHVWLDGRRFADELLAAGLAESLVIAPNGRHARTQLALELAARARRVGMWGAC